MSGNPNPQHNPTDGLGVAAYVQVSGTGITADQTVASNKPNPGKYNLTLSLSASGGHAATCAVTPTLVDVSNSSYSPVGSYTYKSYQTAQATFVAGTITAVAVGQAIVEVQFPAFDSTNSVLVGMITAQILVQVIP